MSDIEKKAIPRLLDPQMKTAEYVRNDWIVIPEKGTQIEHMLDTTYWQHVAKKLKAYDRIEVRPTDNSWWAELLVLAVAPFTAKVMLLREVNLNRSRLATPQAPLEVPGGYKIEHRGARGFIVEREADKQILVEGKGTMDEALLWLKDHLRKMAA